MENEHNFNTGISGKVAVISGAASGIGKSCALHLSAAGAKAALFDIDVERGQDTATAISDKGGQALFLNCDVSKDQSCRTAINQVVDNFGKIDILVNAAGIVTRASVVETSEADWDRIIAVKSKISISAL